MTWQRMLQVIHISISTICIKYDLIKDDLYQGMPSGIPQAS